MAFFFVFAFSENKYFYLIMLLWIRLGNVLWQRCIAAIFLSVRHCSLLAYDSRKHL